MCMMPQSSGSTEDVELEPVKALAGKSITTQDPRFKPNKPKKLKRMNLRINKP